MKKTLFLLVGVAVIGSSQSFSQSIVNESHPTKALFGVTVPIVHPLVLVDGFETDMQSMAVDPNNIESISILKNGSAIELYGDKAKDGAILIKMKAGSQFYTITDFVDPSKNLNKTVTKIQLNGKWLINMNKLLVDKTALPPNLVSADGKTVDICSLSPDDTLVINTKFADKK
jgi:hypothetical protein